MERFVNVINARRETMLHISAQIGNVQMMMLLLDYGGEIYARNAFGQTPLHCAVSYEGETYLNLKKH
jgi:ankyrin repeat protein